MRAAKGGVGDAGGADVGSADGSTSCSAYMSSMRDALVRKQVGALMWIDGNDNPADALTRPSRRANSRPKQLVRAAMAGRM